jgi:hypothetical protein
MVSQGSGSIVPVQTTSYNIVSKLHMSILFRYALNATVIIILAMVASEKNNIRNFRQFQM